MTPKKHINKILPPTQSRDNPQNLLMFMCFLFLKDSIIFWAGAVQVIDCNRGTKLRVPLLPTKLPINGVLRKGPPFHGRKVQGG